MTTVNRQKEMFYVASRRAAQNALAEFIRKRHAERYRMVEAWRLRGALESEWVEIEKYDADTDKQEQILEEMMRG